VVLVTSNFRYLASAPEVRWRARAGALARAGAEAPASACYTTASLLEGARRGGSYREVEGGRGEEGWRWAGMYTARERRRSPRI
jgi:hypothetical protein